MSRAGYDILADPFAERSEGIASKRLQLLGADFRFESEAPPLLELVTVAYSGLPRQRLRSAAPQIRIRMVLLPAHTSRRAAEPAPTSMISGPAFLCAADDASSFAIVSPSQRSGLISLNAQMLRHAYHARYEYLEFAVFTLAARVQGLVPLHAACIGRRGEGVLMIGPSGSGKSTAALHALLRGMEFLAEDAVFVDNEGLLATGVANYLHVCRNSLHWLRRTSAYGQVRSSPVIRRRSGVRKFEVDLRHGAFHLAASALRLTAVVFLSPKSAGRQPLLQPLPRAQLCSQLASNQPYAAGRPEWPSFLKKIESLPAYTLYRGSHPNDAVDAIEALLAMRSDRHSGR